MISVFINGRYLTQTVTGVQRCAAETVKAINGLVMDGEYPRSEWTFTLLAPPSVQGLPELSALGGRSVGRTRGVFWEQVELPLHSRHGLLLSFANMAPLATRRQCVIIHDASVFAVPETYRPAFRLWYQFLLPRLGRRADRILTVSRFSQQELVRRARIPEHKLAVVPPAGEHILSRPADSGVFERHHIGSRPYVLAVGSTAAHKNFDRIALAVSLIPRDDFDLVVAGGSNAGVFAAQSRGPSPRVRHLGYVDDGELRALYERALCLVYPSLYEGFGLPPLEAMVCGCPVIVSNVASLPEVCGDAALYCDPYDPRDIAARISEVLDTVELRQELSRRAINRARLFRWNDTARAVLREVRSAVAQRSGPGPVR